MLGIRLFKKYLIVTFKCILCPFIKNNVPSFCKQPYEGYITQYKKRLFKLVFGELRLTPAR